MLVALFVTTMLLQLALTRDPDLPMESTGRILPAPADTTVGSIAAASEILDRPLFSPTRRGGGTGGVAGQSIDAPLGDAIVAGMVSGRGFARAVLRLSDGSVQQVSLGGSYRGWRLEALTPDAARFIRNGEHIKINYGSGSPPTSTDKSDSDEEQ